MRVATWESPQGIERRGVFALFTGQTEFLEKYREVIDELATRGFAGASLDWSGQGGSDRTLADPLKAHVGEFAEYDHDLKVFMEKVVRPLSDSPPLALAHSMGAHILIRALHARPYSFSAAVMTAPMIETATRGFPAGLVRLVCGAHNFAGLANEWVWGMRKRDPLHMRFEDNLVTSDRARFARAQALLSVQEDIRLAGPTWGWLEAALRSISLMRAPGYAEAITTPCLLFGAGRDRVVRTSAVRDFARRLPNATYVEIPDAEHEILMENDTIRAQFWSAFDAFVGCYRQSGLT